LAPNWDWGTLNWECAQVPCCKQNPSFKCSCCKHTGLDSWDSGLPLPRFPREFLKKNEENELVQASRNFQKKKNSTEFFMRRRFQNSFEEEEGEEFKELRKH
jgi:hypothetical protein